MNNWKVIAETRLAGELCSWHRTEAEARKAAKEARARRVYRRVRVEQEIPA